MAVARALLTSPRLLLMDEPLAALDHQRKQEILPYLEKLARRAGIPILYVSHAPDEVARLADHLVVLQGGRALAAGPLGETLARLDLPIQLGEDAGAVIDAAIAERDAAWHLVRVDFPGGSLWVRDNGQPIGHRVRVRVLARDVSLAHSKGEDSSILNALPAKVVAVADDTHPAMALVRLDVGRSPLIARLTKRSVAGARRAGRHGHLGTDQGGGFDRMTRAVPRQSLRRDDDISGICFFYIPAECARDTWQQAHVLDVQPFSCRSRQRWPAVRWPPGPAREELFPFLRV